MGLDIGTVTLHDMKGRTAVKRPHVVPMTKLALVQIAAMREDRDESPGPFSLDGKRTIAIETLSKAVRAISNELRLEDLEKNREQMPPLRMGDLRRTCETLLAQHGVTKDVRAQLLSHGLTGVQEKHYDRNLYLTEKRQALQRWERVLKGLSGGRRTSVKDRK